MGNVCITIDGGTTNTRCLIWDQEARVIASCKCNIGARNGAMEHGNDTLKVQLKHNLEQVLTSSGHSWRDVEYILACGMITCSSGLYELPHLSTPAGLKELSEGIQTILLPEVSPVPIHFIPGVKNHVNHLDFESIDQMDMMRGEETESMALLRLHHTGSPMLLILPGSHNNYISVDEQSRITGCMTSMSGEILSSLTQNTILAASVNCSFLDESELDRHWLLNGYKNSCELGIGRAAFLTRVLHLFCELSPQQLGSYLLGTVLALDLEALRGSKAIIFNHGFKIVIGGRGTMALALSQVLEEEYPNSEVLLDRTEYLAGMGARLIWQTMNTRKYIQKTS